MMIGCARNTFYFILYPPPKTIKSKNVLIKLQHVFPFPSSSFFIVTFFSSFLFPTDYSSWIYRHAVDSFCPFACL
ncbi:hypothetical protein L1887_27622 [Cichorium endivia]|nr:hypothetical protein L1887_27622 [Cichorium endivia]